MIKLKKVWKQYQLDKEMIFTALKNINLSIDDGEFSSIMGPSGSGKSTLMHIIGLLDKPSQGNILIEGKDIFKLDDDALSQLRNEFVGFVFQQFNLINKLTILENIILPSAYLRQKTKINPEKKARELIEKFGLSGKENSFPNKISGGQQQRVAIARSLMMNPKLILADEPTGNLDTKTGQDIIQLLKKLNKEEKRTIIIVTHDPGIAAQTERIIKIVDGQLV